MQAYFAYEQGLRSSYSISLQKIEHFFRDDMYKHSEEDNNSSQITLQKIEKAQKCFKISQEKKIISFEKDYSDDIKEAVIASYTYYNQEFQNNKNNSLEFLLTDIKELEYIYIFCLLIPVELSKILYEEKKRKIHSKIIGNTIIQNDYNLLENKIIVALQNNKKLHSSAIAQKISYNYYHEELLFWYKTFLKTDEKYKEYTNKNSPDLEEDKAILRHFFSNILFKEEKIDVFLREKNICWEENRHIIKGLIASAIKSFPTEIGDIDIPNIWIDEEYQLFSQTLCKKTIETNEYTETLISEYAKNWDISRLTLTDKVILKLCVTEMIHFSSIPLKVSMNEYIEIAKVYSTDKSKEFINGILETIKKKLIQDNKIQKTGRGLIDNQ